MATKPGETTAPKTTMTAFPSDANRAATTITTEHLALIGFAARLGTCVNNDASSGADGDDGDAKSVRDEAMLLMSLLMGEKAQEILSEEIGAKESRCEKRRRTLRNNGDGIGNFSFTFPSLSLQPDAEPAAEASAAPQTGEGEAQEDDEDLPPPSRLLSRTKSVNDKDNIRDSAEAMAHNVLESFGAALVWRAKTWVQSLAKVLALKEQERIEALKDASSGEGDDEDEEEGAGDSPTKEHDNEDLMNSKEMQIIGAIVKSSEEVSVVNVKTSFRVLPNGTASPKNGSKKSLESQDQDEPSAKKAKTEVTQYVDEYKVTHKLLFEATVSMTSNDGVRYNGIKLQAPGYIQGTFTGKSGASSTKEGEETLSGVSMTMDTDALALSLERQSRLVVRRAAEAALLAASGVDCSSSPKYLESPHVHQSIISPRYVLMSPVPATYPVSESPALPPVPSVKDLAEGGNSSSDPSNVVSSSEGHSSDSSAATSAPSLKPAAKKVTAPHSPSFPALLSVANEELSRGES